MNSDSVADLFFFIYREKKFLSKYLRVSIHGTAKTSMHLNSPKWQAVKGIEKTNKEM